MSLYKIAEEYKNARDSLTSGDKVLLLEGTYNLTSGVVLRNKNVVMEGMGHSTIL